MLHMYVYIYIYACGAMLFTLNKVVVSIDVYDGLNSINTWTVFVLSANWNVQVDRTHTKLFYSHLIVHGQLIDCWRKSSSELYTAGSFLYLNALNEHKRRRKKNRGWLHFFLKKKERGRERRLYWQCLLS
jgi:hypothetical protein